MKPTVSSASITLGGAGGEMEPLLVDSVVGIGGLFRMWDPVQNGTKLGYDSTSDTIAYSSLGRYGSILRS